MIETQAENPASPPRSTATPTHGVAPVDANGELIEHLKAYAKERPDVAAIWCLGIGFVLGWKLKPW